MGYDTNILRGRSLHLQNNYDTRDTGEDPWTDHPVSLRSNKRIRVETELEACKEVRFRQPVSFDGPINAPNIRQVTDPATGGANQVLTWFSSTTYGWSDPGKGVPDPAGVPEDYVLTRDSAALPDGYAWKLAATGPTVPFPVSGDNDKFLQVQDYTTGTLQWTSVREVPPAGLSHQVLKMNAAATDYEFGDLPWAPRPTTNNKILRATGANTASWQDELLTALSDIPTPTAGLYLKATGISTFVWDTPLSTGSQPFDAGTAYTNEGQYHNICWTASSQSTATWRSPIPLPLSAADDGKYLRVNWVGGSNLQATFSWEHPLTDSCGNPSTAEQIIVSTGTGRGDWAWQSSRVLPSYATADDRSSLELITGTPYWARRWLLPGATGFAYQQYSVPIIDGAEPFLNFGTQIDPPTAGEASYQLTATNAADGVSLKTWGWTKIIPEVQVGDIGKVLTATSLGSEPSNYAWQSTPTPAPNSSDYGLFLISRETSAGSGTFQFEQLFLTEAVYRWTSMNTTGWGSPNIWAPLTWDNFPNTTQSSFGLGFSLHTSSSQVVPLRIGLNTNKYDLVPASDIPILVTISGEWDRDSGTGDTIFGIRPRIVDAGGGTPPSAAVMPEYKFLHNGSTHNYGFSFTFVWVWTSPTRGAGYTGQNLEFDMFSSNDNLNRNSTLRNVNLILRPVGYAGNINKNTWTDPQNP